MLKVEKFSRWRIVMKRCCLVLIGLVGALVGCGYDPYPTPKPVRSPIGDSPYVVQRANYDATLLNGQVAHVGVAVPARVDRTAPIIKPFEQWTEKEAAADALGRIGAPAIPYLQQALKSPDPETKKQAAEVLARMGNDAAPAVNDLIVLLNDPDPEVRKVAVRTLGRIGPDAAAAVPALMQSLIEQQPAPPAIAPPPAVAPPEPLPLAPAAQPLPPN
jgi:hypothetical protein